jgi:hypothetical protein
MTKLLSSCVPRADIIEAILKGKQVHDAHYPPPYPIRPSDVVEGSARRHAVAVAVGR